MRVVRVVSVLAAVVALLLGGGVAGAAPGGSFADRSIVRTSDDGWKVHLGKFGERVHSVPALSSGHGSYEAFLDLRGTAEITGRGSSPVDAAVLTTGFQVACQWQMDGVQVGVTGGPTAQMSISYPPAMVIGAQVMPSISTTLRNGTSTDVKFATKQLRGPKAGARMEGVRVEISGCVGLAKPAVRAYVRVAMSTAVNDNTFSLYGKPHHL
ncbi:MAG: MspA family porin [Gordonia sp. (in: high G+C Gram-positive bacteria)]|uniref:MspA family porin n=1 Tax=Gordonia sp. (in: high G+C Gram-positive bacteria) TaxID=84139 RepID=UPI003C78F463